MTRVKAPSIWCSGACYVCRKPCRLNPETQMDDLYAAGWESTLVEKWAAGGDSPGVDERRILCRSCVSFLISEIHGRFWEMAREAVERGRTFAPPMSRVVKLEGFTIPGFR